MKVSGSYFVFAGGDFSRGMILSAVGPSLWLRLLSGALANSVWPPWLPHSTVLRAPSLAWTRFFSHWWPAIDDVVEAPESNKTLCKVLCDVGPAGVRREIDCSCDKRTEYGETLP